MGQGFQFLKMDIGINLVADIPGTINAPPDMMARWDIMHPFTGIQLTTKGIDHIVNYVGAIRDEIGYELPIAADHFGHLNLESCIRLGRALDQFTLAWYEDMIPWQFTDQWLRLAQSVTTPVCTGEDIYLKEGFRELVEQRAVGVIHPDIMTSGGIMETKKIGDYAQDHGVAMAMHMAGTPVAALASVHAAAATAEFPRAGEPLGGHRRLERSGQRAAQSDRQRRLHQGAGDAGTRLHRPEPRSLRAVPASRRSVGLRADRSLVEGTRARPAVELSGMNSVYGVGALYITPLRATWY